MTRFEGADTGAYSCAACGAVVPSFQGLYWFVEERENTDGVVDDPVCPLCGATAIRLRDDP